MILIVQSNKPMPSHHAQRYPICVLKFYSPRDLRRWRRKLLRAVRERVAVKCSDADGFEFYGSEGFSRHFVESVANAPETPRRIVEFGRMFGEYWYSLVYIIVHKLFRSTYVFQKNNIQTIVNAFEVKLYGYLFSYDQSKLLLI